MGVLYRGSIAGNSLPSYDKIYTEKTAVVYKVYIDPNDIKDGTLSEVEKIYSEINSTDYISKNMNMYGAIRFKLGQTKQLNENKLDFAFPLDKSIHTLPVVGETVLIEQKGPLFYYTRLNYNNSSNFDTNPYVLAKTIKTTNESDSSLSNSEQINEISSTGIFNNTNQNETSNTNKSDRQGEYFKRDLRTHQLLLREGDTIFQGRFGNSIRLSGYLHSNKDDGISYPAFIIRNGESAANKAKQVYDVVDEDINNDGSSIHITSGEYITPYTPTSTNSTRYQFPSEAKGDQIILNTDRLTLSTKGDDIFLISNRNLSIFANDTVSIDASSIDFTANDGNVRITAQANNDVIIAVEGGKVLLGADNSESSVDANQMILGNKLISLIDRLIQAINLMTIATPSGPSAPGPIDKATFTGLANELKDCLSSTNYLV